MADTKISDLAAVTDVLATDEYVLARSGATKKIDASNLLVASEVAFTPAGTIAATDVQAAIVEVATEAAASAGDIALLASFTLGSDTASFDFTSISGSWSQLKLMGLIRGTEAATSTEIRVRFNGDTGSNYSWIWQQTRSAAAAESTDGTGTSITMGHASGASAPSGAASPVEFLIPGYAGTVFHKGIVGLMGRRIGTGGGGSNYLSTRGTGFWASTSAITQVTIFPGSNNWLTGSKMSLYGLA